MAWFSRFWRISAAGIALVAFAAGTYFALRYDFQRPGPLKEPVTLIIERGESRHAIARTLANAHVVRLAPSFLAQLELFASDRMLKFGEYAFAPHQSAAEIVDKLARGDVVIRRFTVAEGLTNFEIRALIAENQALSGELPPLPGEGALLPETYFYRYGDERAELVHRMERDMRMAVAEIWAKRVPDLPLKSPDELVVLASIVEKETAIAEERPRVASVFVNRLRRGMRLQSDPTVIYALTQGRGILGRPLTRIDLAVKDPFNTYVVIGLPPRPITNPGRASLEAAANPAETNDLYFVADGNGGHAFSRTLEEHNRKVASWLKLRTGPGGN